jgi:LacI family transcriptional regulator
MSTMRQVADRAGVSAETVSRVINNARYVSPGVRQRVEAAIAELNHVPNVASSSRP